MWGQVLGPQVGRALSRGGCGFGVWGRVASSISVLVPTGWWVREGLGPKASELEGDLNALPAPGSRQSPVSMPQGERWVPRPPLQDQRVGLSQAPCQ